MAKAETPKFDPFQTGALYDQHSPRWDLEQDFAEPVLDTFAAGKHLPRFSDKEKQHDYSYRCSMSAPLDMCADAIRIRMANIFRTAPQRDIGGKHKAIIDRLVDDADNDGTTLEVFMRRALYHHYSTGCDILTQMSAAPDGMEIKTKADEIEAGLKPYFLQFNPLQRFDWATNGSGNFIWARYCLGEEVADSEDSGSEGWTKFLSLSRNEWILRRARHEMTDDGEVLKVEIIGQGQHKLGKPPISKLYFTESQKFGQGAVPISLISRPALIAKVALNLKSQADVDLLAAVARWMFTGRETPPDAFGPLMLVASQDPESKLLVVQSDVNHIREKREWLMLYILEILRLLKFRGGMGNVEVSQGSGVRLTLEMTDLLTELRDTAALMEATELEMMRQAVILATGADIPPERAKDELEYASHYNRDYVLEPVEQMLANLKAWMKECGFLPEQMPEITKEMLRQLANMLAREGSPVAVQMAEEIDKADFEGTSEAGQPEPVEAE